MKLPKELDFLLGLISPNFLAVLPKLELLKIGTSLSANTIKNKIPTTLPKNIAELSESDSKKKDLYLGQLLLELYFKQILYPCEYIILDLRYTHFSYQDEVLLWEKTALVTTLSSDFKQGLKLLYEGFYQSDEDSFAEGLRLLRLFQTQEQQEKISTLFKDYFQKGADGEMKFDVAEFIFSFDKIFAYLIDEKVKIHPEFIYLGMMLGTLYWSLQHLGPNYNAAEAFNKVHSGS